jgi:fimbrial isopeptide formation D2 family protein
LSPPPSTIGGVPNSYLAGQKVTATYRCTDALSGVVQCGTSKFSSGVKDTGTLSTTIDTSKAGSNTFTVNAVDAAGNNATPASVTYNVVSSPPVSLAILKLAPLLVKHNAQMTYAITAVNLSSKAAASSVTITDVLPSGLTLLKATANQWVCSNGKCSNTASCTTSGNSVTCTSPSMSVLTPISVEIVVQVTANPGTKIENTATVGSSNPIVPPGNTKSTAITLVF